MKIEPGMKFRGNKSGREIEVLRADNQAVVYRDCKYGTVFTVGRKAFVYWDISRVKGYD